MTKIGRRNYRTIGTIGIIGMVKEKRKILLELSFSDLTGGSIFDSPNLSFQIPLVL